MNADDDDNPSAVPPWAAVVRAVAERAAHTGEASSRADAQALGSATTDDGAAEEAVVESSAAVDVAAAAREVAATAAFAVPEQRKM